MAGNWKTSQGTLSISTGGLDNAEIPAPRELIDLALETVRLTKDANRRYANIRARAGRRRWHRRNSRRLFGICAARRHVAVREIFITILYRLRPLLLQSFRCPVYLA